MIAMQCPYGEPKDRLWVREAFRPIYPQQASYNGGRPIGYDYREGYQLGYRMGDSIRPPKWKPSIHMPREACRIVLEIVSVRVELLSDISEADAIAEGIGSIRVSETDSRWLNYANQDSKAAAFGDPRQSFWSLWKSINGGMSLAANPWVWVIEFKRVETA